MIKRKSSFRIRRTVDALLDEAYSIIQLPSNAVPSNSFPERSLVGSVTGPTPPEPPIPPIPVPGDYDERNMPVFATSRRGPKRSRACRVNDDDEVFSVVMTVLDRKDRL